MIVLWLWNRPECCHFVTSDGSKLQEHDLWALQLRTKSDAFQFRCLCSAANRKSYVASVGN